MTLRPATGANEARRGTALRNTGWNPFAGVDRGLLLTTALLLATGLATLYAASYYNAQAHGGALSEVLSQLFGVGVGAAAMLVVLRIDYRILARPWLCGGLLAVSLVLLALVAVQSMKQEIILISLIMLSALLVYLLVQTLRMLYLVL